MSVPGHAEISRTAIVVESWRADVLAMVKTFGASSKAVTAATDIHGMLERLVETVAALDKLADDTKDITAKARTYLSETMQEVGAYSVKADGVQAVLADAVRYPKVIDRAAIPEQYIVTPEPKVDMTRLGVDLRRGASIPGAQLSNGGSPTLRITASANKSRQEAAAA